MLVYLWFVLLLLHTALPQTADKHSDEDKPYKFGFNIQGYQHRQEEKDEKGLIKGEYGFITADGYYRVTVYATDENGDFRIISMKNYYVGFPPEDPTTTPGPPSERARQPQTFGRSEGAAGRALTGEDDSTKAPKAFTRPQGIAACSDCSIPTTPKPNQPNLADRGEFRTGRTRDRNFGFGQGPATGQQQFPQGPAAGQPQFPQGPTGGQQQFPQGPSRANVQTPEQKTAQFPGGVQGPSGGQAPQFPQGGPQNGQVSGRTGSNAPAVPGSSFGGGSGPEQRGGFGPNAAGRALGSPEGLGRGRNDFTGSNRLDGTPNVRPQVGEVRDGLPPGVTVNDIKDLLYTFNYTVGFHGHHEDGYRNGDKQGDYFFDGRDGVERKVEYLANEFGYQPNITLIDLAENDVRRPKEETEKEYGLKGYEFKWFYRK